MNTFHLPDLGEGLTEAEIVRWLVKVGDVVTVDTPIAEVETAKSIVELPCPYAGVIEELHGEPGTTVPVGKPLITVGDPDGAAYRAEERAGSGNVLVGYGTSESSGAGRRRRPRVSGTNVAPTAEKVPERRVPLVISPLVRRLARDAEVDLRTLTGSGPDGLIVRRDVELAIAHRLQTETEPALPQPAVVQPPAAASPVAQPAQPQPVAAQPPAAASPIAEPAQPQPAPPQPVAAPAALSQPGVAQSGDARTGLAELRRTPMSGFRKAVIATLSRSRAEIPEATTWVDVDATALVELRESLRSATDSGPGLLALMARFVVAGLLKYPELNGYVDTEREELVQYDGVNLGLAAQTDRGLMVPAVAGAHALTTRGLDAEIRRLTASARDGRLTQQELTCGTFTLNNYGSFGVDGSAAIINHPQVAILGVGRIIDRPWVVDGELAIRKLTQLSLVFDHRVCDGGTAAAFLRFVADAFENPTSAFADL
ncbi:pyruvate dehydrogenase E2 component (dihydrolipoamide acetyltransferase) [Kribbella sp. VKM Ac-2571]|uniref:dihydrolipoamide acetyltransferase family protein n=1 Tax=Kribbella sp. VKM Ac-2571 TaxID=2512222 RepID=UPI00106117DB|nr:dihydrolipoamide acetyltransferase family protein [Kribbella sp. VKM Ac-2571]TDO62554.1 pyruvate dehydrogenase E2 component (dihydrolipoamide acetyltransferase) [Kribbella sp. VKM Ac-2571]